jgi:dUTP pyrophosphatase
MKLIWNKECEPVYATIESAACDLKVRKINTIKHGNIYTHTIYTGVYISESDPREYLQLYPRSSISNLASWQANSVGIIDGDYRGEITLVLYSFQKTPPYQKGDRCCQLILEKSEKILNISTKQTIRGTGGFGSTGGVSIK